MNRELNHIVERYQRRASIPPDRYSRLNPAVNLIAQEKQRALIKLFLKMGLKSLSGVSILEIGCGSGANLLELIELGADPRLLVGNELLEDRLAFASCRLPVSVRLLACDASQIDMPTASFDIVYQSTVFSSILEDSLQMKVALKIWELVKPGGGILWYDFTYNNPSNPDVRGMPLSRIRMLFPRAEITARRVTLAPPIARCVVPVSGYLYGVFNSVPFLRTHLLCYLKKL